MQATQITDCTDTAQTYFEICLTINKLPVQFILETSHLLYILKQLKVL